MRICNGKGRIRMQNRPFPWLNLPSEREQKIVPDVAILFKFCYTGKEKTDGLEPVHFQVCKEEEERLCHFKQNLRLRCQEDL